MARLQPDQIDAVARLASEIVLAALHGKSLGSVDYEDLAAKAVDEAAARLSVRVRRRDRLVVLTRMLQAWALVSASMDNPAAMDVLCEVSSSSAI